jgi:hypothetical protein
VDALGQLVQARCHSGHRIARRIVKPIRSCAGRAFCGPTLP